MYKRQTHQLFRGSAVLGWSAAIDRVHRVIEKTGFATFNAASKTMAAATTGRFKRFSKAANITSIGELREYFDGDILWVLELSLIHIYCAVREPFRTGPGLSSVALFPG